MANSDANYLLPPSKQAFQLNDGLSFSARDLLTRLVREDCTIRGSVASLTEPLWFIAAPVLRLSYKLQTCASCCNTDLSNFGRIGFSLESNCTTHPWLERKRQVAKPLLMPSAQRRNILVENNHQGRNGSCIRPRSRSRVRDQNLRCITVY